MCDPGAWCTAPLHTFCMVFPFTSKVCVRLVIISQSAAMFTIFVFIFSTLDEQSDPQFKLDLLKILYMHAHAD